MTCSGSPPGTRPISGAEHFTASTATTAISSISASRVTSQRR
ncbi:hypothetical protein MGSAQ_001048 [marine sediment metagenome]|uniref:Uncharacterized protein n=1 Tax=marine sediment metagenome TaxID=412755 RepID=A0A1B6NXI8_9ZZZZ